MNTTYRDRRRLFWDTIIVSVLLLVFEVFNYSTTQFALNDLFGDLGLIGIRWATILALVFCGIDFIGIARLFTSEQERDEPAKVWYFFGVWLLVAAMNATLTWWGVSVAISNHASLSNGIISGTALAKVVPVFVAIMAWLIRVLIMATFVAKSQKLLESRA